MKQLPLLLLTCLALATATGCSFLFDTEKNKKGHNTRDTASLASPVVEKTQAGIEVTWEVPSDPVDGFVIRYGADRSNLTKETTIFLSELREERDPQYGPVYRYILRDIPESGLVYIAVAAFKGDALSDFSDAIAEQR